MSRYLTKKAEKASWWEVPALFPSGLFIAAGISAFVEDIPTDTRFASLLAWACVMALAVAPLYFLLRRMLRRRQARNIAARLEKKRMESIPLFDLDRVCGVTGAQERIANLLSQGFLQGVSLDQENRCLWLMGAGGKTAGPEEPAQPELTDEGYREMLKKIRELNGRIADRSLSQRIDRLEAVTASIFRTLELKPDKARDARRFMSYYLPTIFKLLETYDLLEEQSYQGETIRASRKQIEEILEKLVQGVEQLQDKLFSADALDVEAEIKVMETMMAADGLTEEGTLRAMGR